MNREQALAKITARREEMRKAGIDDKHANRYIIGSYPRAATIFWLAAHNRLTIIPYATKDGEIRAPVDWPFEVTEWKQPTSVDGAIVEAGAYVLAEQELWDAAGGGQQDSLKEMLDRCVDALVLS